MAVAMTITDENAAKSIVPITIIRLYFRLEQAETAVLSEMSLRRIVDRTGSIPQRMMHMIP